MTPSKAAGGYAITAARLDDAACIANLFQSAVADGGGAGWSAEAVRSTLAGNGFGFIANSKDGAPVGAALAHIAADEAELINIAVLPDRRGHGCARQLLEKVIAQACAGNAKKLLLEASVENTAALNLYRSFGFKSAGLRKGYYKRGDRSVDAEIMSVAICSF